MKFKRQAIGVTWKKEEPCAVPIQNALVLGSLAIHRPANGVTGYFNVTHVPTGYTIAQGSKLRNCKALVLQLTALDVDWSFKDAHAPPQSFHEIAIPILRAFNSDVNN